MRGAALGLSRTALAFLLDRSLDALTLRQAKLDGGDVPSDTPRATCAVEGCSNPVKARGWCNTHYLRWRAHGDPTTTRPRLGPLTSDDDPRHGTENGYNNLGCRCARCRAAHARTYRDRRARNAAAVRGAEAAR